VKGRRSQVHTVKKGREMWKGEDLSSTLLKKGSIQGDDHNSALLKKGRESLKGCIQGDDHSSALLKKGKEM
jgi:hypothetical protein